MIVVCINNDNTYKWQNPLPITIGKKYQHIKNFFSFEELYYTIIDDDGEEHNYYKEKFLTLEEFRERQIGNLVE